MDQKIIEAFCNTFFNFSVIKHYFREENNDKMDKEYCTFLCLKLLEHPLSITLLKDYPIDNPYFDNIIIWLLCFTKDSIKKNPYAHLFLSPFDGNSEVLYNIRYILTNYICSNNFDDMCIDYDNIINIDKLYYQEYQKEKLDKSNMSVLQ